MSQKGNALEKQKIVVLGFSGNAREAFDTISTDYTVAAFLDDRTELHGTFFEGAPILPMARITDFPDAQVICMIGSEKSFRQRHDIIARLCLPASRFASILHPMALVSRLAKIGRGAFLYPGVYVLANAVIGDHVLIMPNSVIHHDSVVGDYSMIGSGVIVAGGVRIGESCYIGSGTTIKNNVDIAECSLVGLGSNVLRDVGSRQVVAGNPARILRQD